MVAIAWARLTQVEAAPMVRLLCPWAISVS